MVLFDRKELINFEMTVTTLRNNIVCRNYQKQLYIKSDINILPINI